MLSRARPGPYEDKVLDPVMVAYARACRRMPLQVSDGGHRSEQRRELEVRSRYMGSMVCLGAAKKRAEEG